MTFSSQQRKTGGKVKRNDRMTTWRRESGPRGGSPDLERTEIKRASKVVYGSASRNMKNKGGPPRGT